MKNKNKIIFAGLIGNILEYYDFAIFTVSIPLILDYFLPRTSSITPVTFALNIYIIGIISRFAGGLIFGYIGDKFGRKKTLMYSLLVSGLCTTLLALLPGHAELGAASTIMLFIIRILQGICIGGEAPNASVFIIEHFKGQTKGKLGGYIVATAASGTVLALLVGLLFKYIFNDSTLSWRIPFLIGGITAFASMYIRKKIDETPIFLTLKQHNIPNKLPIKELLQKHYKNIAIAAAVASVTGAMSLTVTGYLNIYLQKILFFQATTSMYCMLLTSVVFICSLVLMGHVCDILGPERLFNTACYLIILTMGFIFYYISAKVNLGVVLMCTSMIAILASMVCSCIYSYLYLTFQPEHRCSGFSFSINLGVSTVALLSEVLHRLMRDTTYSQALCIITACILYLVIHAVAKKPSRNVITRVIP